MIGGRAHRACSEILEMQDHVIRFPSGAFIVIRHRGNVYLKRVHTAFVLAYIVYRSARERTAGVPDGEIYSSVALRNEDEF